MIRIQFLALAAAIVLAACGGKKSDAPAKQPPTAATTPPAATPPAATPPAAATELKLPIAVRTPGTRWTKTDEMTSKMQIGAADKQVAVDGQRRFVSEIEVVEVDAAGLVTKVKAGYAERSERETMGDKSREKPQPLAGKRYLVWAEGGALAATHDDGSAVSPEELAELTKDLDEVGKPRVMDELVAGRTWKVGETYTFTADELARLNAAKGPNAPAGAAMALTLREVAGERATFAMTSTMKVETKASMKMDMAGTVVIDTRTGRPLELVLAGPIEGTVNGQPVGGSMSGKVVYAYAAP